MREASHTFGNKFRDAGNAAGVAKSAHGVRKIGATSPANNGATIAELEAIFGWQRGGMASLYTRAADRARLAKGAMVKLGGTNGEQTIHALNEKVTDSVRKERRYETLSSRNQIIEAAFSGAWCTRPRALMPRVSEGAWCNFVTAVGALIETMVAVAQDSFCVDSASSICAIDRRTRN